MKIDKILKIIKSNSYKCESIYSGLMYKKDINILKKNCKDIIVNEYRSVTSSNKIYVVIDLYKKN